MFCLTPRLIPEKAVIRPALVLSFLPGLNGTDMTKMSYSDQLKHPNWQRKRLEVLESAGWCCQRCRAGEVTLHVHHRAYVKGRMAWEYEGSELEALCKDCHEGEHADQEIFATLGPLLQGAGHGGAERAFVSALALACGAIEPGKLSGGNVSGSYWMEHIDAFRFGWLLHVAGLGHPMLMRAILVLITSDARMRSPDSLDEVYARVGNFTRRTTEASISEKRLVEALGVYLEELAEESRKQKGFD